MNTRRALIGAVIALPIIGLLAYGLTRNPRDVPSMLRGQPAPQFALPTLTGQDTLSLADYQGRVVVVNFWASWCIPCRVEHEPLNKAERLYRDRGVVFLGVLYKDKREDAIAWLKAMGGQDYQTVDDVGARAAINYGLSGVPETFVIDRTGHVAYKKIGPFLHADSLAKILEPLLAAPIAEK
jgi:cytochrome c biogenesis protein CcmG/thiol:disulfide interchange protein DsbE